MIILSISKFGVYVPICIVYWANTVNKRSSILGNRQTLNNIERGIHYIQTYNGQHKQALHATLLTSLPYMYDLEGR